MNKTLTDQIIWLLTALLFSAFLIFENNIYLSYILIVITGLVFVAILFKYHFIFTLCFDKYQYHILTFATYCGITGLWAINASASIGKAITILEIMVCMTVFYSYYSLKDSVGELLECIRWSGYITSLYAISFYGMDTIRRVIEEEARVDNSFANINSIAMIAAISLVLTIFRLLYHRISPTMLLVLPEIILISASGSRKALMVVGLGVILLCAFRYATRDVVKTLIRYIALAVLLFFLISFILTLPVFAGIVERMQGMIAAFTGVGNIEHSALLRKLYIAAGIEQFKRTPFFGIGISNSSYILMAAFGKDTYLHNNFVELLACGGIIGFVIYYAMFIWPMWKIWKNREYGDESTDAVLVLLIITVIMDYGMVSYYSKSTYFYLMIFYLQAKLLLRQDCEKGQIK